MCCDRHRFHLGMVGVENLSKSLRFGSYLVEAPAAARQDRDRRPL